MTKNNEQAEKQVIPADLPPKYMPNEIPPGASQGLPPDQAIREQKLKRIQKMLDGDLAVHNPTLSYFIQKMRDLQRDMGQAQGKLQQHEQMVQTLRTALIEMKASFNKYIEDSMVWDQGELPKTPSN